jgi:hypothetical protein
VAVWFSIKLFGTVYGNLVLFFPVLVCLDQEKSGNPDVLPFMHSYFCLSVLLSVFCMMALFPNRANELEATVD